MQNVECPGKKVELIALHDRPIVDTGIAPEYRNILYENRFPGFADATSCAYMAIDGLIWDGKLIPGQRLIEGDLSTQLDIQRGYIREALRLLAADGIVELIPNKGARLRQLSPAQLVHITELLNGVFCMSVDILINQRPALGKKNRKKLENATISVESALEVGGVASQAARYIEYHLLVNSMTENPYLNQLLSRMHLAIYHRELLGNLTVTMIRQAPLVYRLITEAIFAGDFGSAKKALDSTREFLRDNLTK